MLKKTMLTCETLDRFEKEVDINFLTDAAQREVEHCAFAANMGRHDEKEIWSWFRSLIADSLHIRLSEF
jgi:hypothetical protein